jgi:SNF2 family DNA or RNA helicase
MNSKIVVQFDPKTRRLVFTVPFFLADAVREFPSRRFEPRTKTWRVPLLKSNMQHLARVQHKYSFDIAPEAQAAIEDYERLTAAPKKVPFPQHVYDFTKSTTGYAPMAHQLTMLDTSWGLNASAWFAKMGTGKTFAAIHLAFARWVAGEIDAVVIICPSTLRSVWRKEFAKFATGPYEYRVHEQRASWYDDFCRESSPDRLQVLAVSVEGLGISGGLYDSVCQFYSRGKRVLTICDESSRIKNPDAKRTERTIELGRASAYRLILNGTPIAVGIQDLWSQYEFLDPNIIGMGDFWAFKTRYLVKGGYENKKIIGYQNVDELMALVAPYTAVVGKEVLDLPPKVMTERFVQITPQQRKLLKLVAKGSSPDPDAPYIKADNVLEKVLRARQIVGGWLPKGHIEQRLIGGEMIEEVTTELVPLDDNPKLNGLIELIEDNYDGSKFIIWSTFVHEIEAIRDILQLTYGAQKVECYYGGVEMSDRSRIEDRYCNDPTMRFFIGNPAAAGLGLTLISGENDVMVYYSGTNAYIDRAQSEDRAHRIGQKNTVAIVDMIAEKTIDEVIVESIRNKTDVETFVTTKIRDGGSIVDLLVQD